MTFITLGKKKKSFSSIKEAAQAAGMPYITYYQRLRAGMTPKAAMKKPVRAYTRRSETVADQASAA